MGGKNKQTNEKKKSFISCHNVHKTHWMERYGDDNHTTELGSVNLEENGGGHGYAQIAAAQFL